MHIDDRDILEKIESLNRAYGGLRSDFGQLENKIHKLKEENSELKASSGEVNKLTAKLEEVEADRLRLYNELGNLDLTKKSLKKSIGVYHPMFEKLKAVDTLTRGWAGHMVLDSLENSPTYKDLSDFIDEIERIKNEP